MAVVVLVSAMGHGISPKGKAKLCEWFGTNTQTLKRWQAWWRESFVKTPWWKQAKGRFSPPVELHRFPLSLLERFTGRNDLTRIVSALVFLCPLTTNSSNRWKAGFFRGDADPQNMSFDMH